MQRFLTPLPATFDIGQIRAATLAAMPKAIDVNQVDVNGTPSAAVYFDPANAPKQTALDQWAAAVAAHVPQAVVNPRQAARDAVVAATTLAQVKTAVLAFIDATS